MNGLDFFRHAFSALTGQPAPFGWQKRFYQKLLKDDLPSACDLPTGLWKTMVIPIWLIALAQQSRENSQRRLPVRLVYIVNRRTVVDQATSVVEQIRQRLLNADGQTLLAHKHALRRSHYVLIQLSIQ